MKKSNLTKSVSFLDEITDDVIAEGKAVDGTWLRGTADVHQNPKEQS